MVDGLSQLVLVLLVADVLRFMNVFCCFVVVVHGGGVWVGGCMSAFVCRFVFSTVWASLVLSLPTEL